MDNSTKQIMYLMLACFCLWLVLSEYVGKKYISTVLYNLFPTLFTPPTTTNTAGYNTQNKSDIGKISNDGSVKQSTTTTQKSIFPQTNKVTNLWNNTLTGKFFQNGGSR